MELLSEHGEAVVRLAELPEPAALVDDSTMFREMRADLT